MHILYPGILCADRQSRHYSIKSHWECSVPSCCLVTLDVIKILRIGGTKQNESNYSAIQSLQLGEQAHSFYSVNQAICPLQSNHFPNNDGLRLGLIDDNFATWPVILNARRRASCFEATRSNSPSCLLKTPLCLAILHVLCLLWSSILSEKAICNSLLVWNPCLGRLPFPKVTSSLEISSLLEQEQDQIPRHRLTPGTSSWVENSVLHKQTI